MKYNDFREFMAVAVHHHHLATTPFDVCQHPDCRRARYFVEFHENALGALDKIEILGRYANKRNKVAHNMGDMARFILGKFEVSDG